MNRERILDSGEENRDAPFAATTLQGNSPSRRGFAQGSAEIAEQLLLSSSSLDPVEATLSPSKRTKHLSRRNRGLLESLKGPVEERPQIKPTVPFSFAFGADRDKSPSHQSKSHSGSSSSSQELVPPTTTPSKRLKEMRPSFHAASVIPSSPKPKPFRPESSPELPDVPQRTQGSSASLKKQRTQTPPDALLSSIPPPLPTEDSHASQCSTSYALRAAKLPRGSVPSSAISQESAPAADAAANRASLVTRKDASQDGKELADSSEKSLLARLPSHRSQHGAANPSSNRRLQLSDDHTDPDASEDAPLPLVTSEKRLTHRTRRSTTSAAAVEESCLPRDEAEEEMLSQHSQRTVPKQITAEGRGAAHAPLHSASALFRGLKFFVTGLQPMNETEAEEYDENLREKVCGWLIARGGVVEDDIERVHMRDRKSLYPGLPSVILISDRARTTIKYLSALAAGIPCVHYSWLEHCIDTKSIMPCHEYLLPAGFSQSLQKIVTHDEFTQPNALDGIRVEILGGSPYLNIWSKIIRAAGGKCVRRLFTPDEEHIDVICSPEEYLITIHIRNKADELKKPLVSLNWIKQCLIDRRLMPFRPYSIQPPKK